MADCRPAAPPTSTGMSPPANPTAPPSFHQHPPRQTVERFDRRHETCGAAAMGCTRDAIPVDHCRARPLVHRCLWLQPPPARCISHPARPHATLAPWQRAAGLCHASPVISGAHAHWRGPTEFPHTQGMPGATQRMFREWPQRYGPLYRCFLGRFPVIVITDADLSRAVALKHFTNVRHAKLF